MKHSLREIFNSKVIAALLLFNLLAFIIISIMYIVYDYSVVMALSHIVVVEMYIMIVLLGGGLIILTFKLIKEEFPNDKKRKKNAR